MGVVQRTFPRWGALGGADLSSLSRAGEVLIAGSAPFHLSCPISPSSHTRFRLAAASAPPLQSTFLLRPRSSGSISHDSLSQLLRLGPQAPCSRRQARRPQHNLPLPPALHLRGMDLTCCFLRRTAVRPCFCSQSASILLDISLLHRSQRAHIIVALSSEDFNVSASLPPSLRPNPQELQRVLAWPPRAPLPPHRAH